MINVEEARRDLLDPAKGFFVIRNLFSSDEVSRYRHACEQSMIRGKRIQERIITGSMEDYVHPRSHDQQERTARLYQYFHNHKDDCAGELFVRAVAIRDEIESAWLFDPIYRSEKETLFDYVIVTQYFGNKGMLPKHQDYDGPAPYPLIQFWVALSEPGIDYEGGNLVLYSKDGTSRRVEGDLALKRGDALVFDKTLPHEVELTRTPQRTGALGRWTVLIGARAPRDTAWEAVKKRLLYGPPLYSFLSVSARALKRLRHSEA